MGVTVRVGCWSVGVLMLTVEGPARQLQHRYKPPNDHIPKHLLDNTCTASCRTGHCCQPRGRASRTCTSRSVTFRLPRTSTCTACVTHRVRRHAHGAGGGGDNQGGMEVAKLTAGNGEAAETR
ncbi:hypothetical protein EDB86DRAFT_1405719 [Lactarius hatsudake]|nr:hypothetical protein EDB86DRAFT_384383 [Lactarius hatsudake]KAH8993075.1 hypothetical protein EDB86DRAFT_1405719 [Lactarius hatsudake]